MQLDHVRQQLPDQSLIFDQPAYDASIVGITPDDHVVYSFSKMVEELVQDRNISKEEAQKFIGYNVIRMLPFMKEEIKPIIFYELN